MSLFSYLFDENVDPHLRAALHRQQPEIIAWLIGDPGAPARGTVDPDILTWCEMRGFSLVTNNRSSMPRHLADHVKSGHHVPGIFILHAEMSLGQIADELLLIWEAVEAEEFTDQIIYLPI